MRQRTLEVGDVERSYHVCAPAGDAGALPVIVALHGKGDNGRDFLAGTGLHQARAIVAAPTGAGRAGRPRLTPAPPSMRMRRLCARLSTTSGPPSPPATPTWLAFPTAGDWRCT